MPIVIDGCNVLGKLGVLFQGGGDKILIENYLIPFQQMKESSNGGLDSGRKKILLVFDNADYNSYEINDFEIKGIIVHFCQKNLKTADEYIEDYIKDYPNKDGITLVSSDSELREFALKQGCSVIKSEEYLNKIKPQIDNDSNEELSGNLAQDINNELFEIWGDK